MLLCKFKASIKAIQLVFGYGNIHGIRIDRSKSIEDLTTLFGKEYDRNTTQVTQFLAGIAETFLVDIRTNHQRCIRDR